MEGELAHYAQIVKYENVGPASRTLFVVVVFDVDPHRPNLSHVLSGIGRRDITRRHIRSQLCLRS